MERTAMVDDVIPLRNPVRLPNGKVVTEIPVTRGQVRAVVRVYISPNTDVFALRSC